MPKGIPKSGRRKKTVKKLPQRKSVVEQQIDGNENSLLNACLVRQATLTNKMHMLEKQLSELAQAVMTIQKDVLSELKLLKEEKAASECPSEASTEEFNQEVSPEVVEETDLQ